MPQVKQRALKARLALPAKGETRKSRRLIERADQMVREAKKLVKAAANMPAVENNPKLRKAARRAVKRSSRAVAETDRLTAAWISEIEQAD